MEPEERYLKDYFKSENKPPRRVLTDEEVRALIQNELDTDRLEDVLQRLSKSPQDQEWVAAARKVLADAPETGPAAAVRAASPRREIRGGMDGRKRGISRCPHCGGGITPFKRPPAKQRLGIVLWTLLSLGGFVLSFVFRGYFMQCLAVAVIAGVKAALDARNHRTQILIYRALESGQEASAQRDLQRGDARL